MKTNTPWPARARELARMGARTLRLVLAADRRLAAALLAFTLICGLMPAAIAYVGKQIVDGVLQADLSGSTTDQTRVVHWVLVELGLVAVLRAVERARWLVDSLLRAQLGQRSTSGSSPRRSRCRSATSRTASSTT